MNPEDLIPEEMIKKAREAGHHPITLKIGKSLSIEKKLDKERSLYYPETYIAVHIAEGLPNNECIIASMCMSMRGAKSFRDSLSKLLEEDN